MIGYMDVNHEVIEKAYERIKEKTGCCKILPAARINIHDDGTLEFATLVCDRRMGSEQAGVAARYCRNCKEEK